MRFGSQQSWQISIRIGTIWTIAPPKTKLNTKLPNDHPNKHLPCFLVCPQLNKNLNSQGKCRIDWMTFGGLAYPHSIGKHSGPWQSKTIFNWRGNYTRSKYLKASSKERTHRFMMTLRTSIKSAVIVRLKRLTSNLLRISLKLCLRLDRTSITSK